LLTLLPTMRALVLSALMVACGCSGTDWDEPALLEKDSGFDELASGSLDAADGSTPDGGDSVQAGDASEPEEGGLGPADGGEDPSDSSTSTPPGASSVLIYSNNIENMLFDWKDLVHVMARDKRKVDVFLVQQMTNKKRLDELAAYMSNRLGEKYAGVVAQNVPTHLRFGAQVTPKPTVTTGVIWRVGRFEYVSHESWFPWGKKVDGVHTCSARTSNSGYETIRVRLRDTWAQEQLAVVSLRHWTWKDCSQENMIEMIDGQPSGPNAHAPMPDVALQVVGGDFNGKALDAAGSFRCWYRVTVAGLGGTVCAGHPNLGFSDPLYDKCQGVASCVQASSGIDFIFGRRAGGKPASTAGWDIVSHAEGNAADVAETGSDKLSNRVATHGFDDVNSNYSQHRARRGVFFY
jgi:hypothetical protein